MLGKAAGNASGTSNRSSRAAALQGEREYSSDAIGLFTNTQRTLEFAHHALGAQVTNIEFEAKSSRHCALAKCASRGPAPNPPFERFFLVATPILAATTSL
jgi:hypothetical protein